MAARRGDMCSTSETLTQRTALRDVLFYFILFYFIYVFGGLQALDLSALVSYAPTRDTLYEWRVSSMAHVAVCDWPWLHVW
jgi:hypothetical protein